MRPNTIGNIATAAFFFVLAALFFLGFLFSLEWPIEGRGIGILILFAIIFAALGYRILWGMRQGE
jgi:hypothetical protein